MRLVPILDTLNPLLVLRSRVFPVIRQSSVCGLVLGVSLLPGSAWGQIRSRGDASDIPENVRQAHMVHVSPHLLVFDPATTSATLAFSNVGDAPTEADVVVQLGYTVWQNRDTALFSRHWQDGLPRDTVVVTPRPQDHYLGRWITGLPTHVVLKPHQTERVTIRLAPPRDLANGEYYARIITMVGPRHNRDRGQSQDTKMSFHLPVVGQVPPLIRDSVRVFYRRGPQSMGVQLLHAAAQLDTSHDGYADYRSDLGPNPLRYVVRLHLTGTAHFEGEKSNYYIMPDSQILPISARDGQIFTLHRDGIMRMLVGTQPLSSGHYTFVFRLIPRQDEWPPEQRVPMDTVQVHIPFDVP